MNPTNRITPAEVLAAFLAISYKPVRGAFNHWLRKECCGASAVHALKSCSSIPSGSGVVCLWLERVYGRDYARGFLCGFDGLEISKHDLGRWRQGMEDGLAAWEAVRHMA